MKRGIGIVLIVFGLLSAVTACTNAHAAPNISYLVGSYLPAILLLTLGLKLRQEATLPASPEAENPPLAVHGRRKANAEAGVFIGILLMFLGSGLAQYAHQIILLGTAILLCGWGLMIWGAVNYVTWKGYSAWLGLFGLLLLPGLIILACLPNRLKNLGAPVQPQTTSNHSILMALLVAGALLIALSMAAFLALPYILGLLPTGQTANTWATISSDPPKFTVEMPAHPKRQVFSTQSPDGESAVTVYSYESHDEIAAYVAGFMPIALDPSQQTPPGSADRLLDEMLDQIAIKFNGQALDRKSISLGPYVGREQTIEFTPPATSRLGAPTPILMLWRIYFVRDSLVMLNVNLPKSASERRETNERIARFFNSIKAD